MNDPRFPGMPDDVVENASKAHCARCKVQIIEAESLTGTIFLNYYVPALGVKRREFLCGLCGLEFREFLYPELVDDEAFQGAKGLLQEAFQRRG